MILEPKNTLGIFPTYEAMSEASAELLISIANKAIALNDRFVVSLSGGHTSELMYKLLSEAPMRDQVKWDKTFIFWGDERYVPADDKRNNAHNARIALLDKIPIPAGNIHPMPTDSTAEESAEAYAKTIKDFFGNDQPRFELIMLGLGENGHTASIFPGTTAVHEVKHLVTSFYLEEEKISRITMTAPLINMADNILFMVSGVEKAAILDEVLNGDPQPDKYPAQLIEPTDGKLYWYVDKMAASLV